MKLCGVRINCLHLDDLFKKTDDCKLLVTVNAEAIVRAQKEERLRRIINSHYASIDGQVPLWLFKSRHKGVDIDKISGSDLIYDVAEWAAKTGKRIYLLGGLEDSNTKAVDILKNRYNGLEIVGYSPEYSPYPFPDEKNLRILSSIKEFKPHVLFVGFGMGKQEFWSEDFFNELSESGVELIVGCGGTFEFVSGKIKRAPKKVQQIGMEGIWRLFQEMKWFRFKRLMTSFKIFYYYWKMDE
ncbi:MAG: WecB/TagA/CpsF family glycosyltransferase [Muribaculaceae bacterium]|nr:WecB/TagA/CpsF family glycosyltransferase [Muribaculaceae bacterium]